MHSLIANDSFIAENPEKIRSFMKAVKRATDYTLANPTDAYKTYIDMKPEMASAVNKKIFERSYAYFSEDLKNVKRDWEKVTKYGKRLGVLNEHFEPNYTNSFLDWELDSESLDPTGDRTCNSSPHCDAFAASNIFLPEKRMVALQQEVAHKGGFRRLDVKIAA
jgi:pyrimidine precursor biosynthesis enzyme